jgi:hypothetical protein
MARTFIQKVLSQRQQDFDGAWDKFSRTVTSQGARSSSDPAAASEKELLSAIRNSKVSKTKTNRGKKLKPITKEKVLKGSAVPASKTTITSMGSSSAMETMLQGPLLRRAVTATVRDAVEAELHARKTNVSRSVKLIEEIGTAYANGIGEDDQNQIESPTSLPMPGKNRSSVFESRRTGGDSNASSIKKGNIGASASDWVSSAAAGATGSTKVVPGESLLLDIPLGLEDTIDKLLKAGALRCYVPEFFSGHTPKAAYEMYLKLPPGLSRIRYEQEAWRWAQPATNNLRLRGLTYIKDILPFSKFTSFLKSADTPPGI